MINPPVYSAGGFFMRTLYEFLNQSGVTSNEVRLIIKRDCEWKKTKEKGTYAYAHFLDQNCNSFDMFVCENGGVIIPLPIEKDESIMERFTF